MSAPAAVAETAPRHWQVGGNYPWALITPQGWPEPQIAQPLSLGVGEEKGPAGEEEQGEGIGGLDVFGITVGWRRSLCQGFCLLGSWRPSEKGVRSPWQQADSEKLDGADAATPAFQGSH